MFEYVTNVDGELKFIRMSRDGIEFAVPIPPEDEKVFVHAASGHYRLLHSYYAEIRVDLNLAEVLVIGPEPPLGWSFYY